jgi:predicted RNase H-like HicB family nuclease
MLANRPYRIGVRPDETTDGHPAFLAFVKELDGCVGDGATRQEAIADVRKAMVDYIESLLEDALPVPTPLDLLPVSVSSGAPLSNATLLPKTPSGDRRPDIQETNRPEHIMMPVAV